MNYHNNIKSHYNIKKHIDQNIIDKLNNVDLDFDYSELKIDTEKHIQTLMLENNSFEYYNNIMSKNSNVINELIDTKDVIQNITEPKKEIMTILCESLFIPLKIIFWIESECSYYYLLKWDNIKISILNDVPVLPKTINNIVRIVKWIILLSNKINPSLNIYIYLSKFKKEITLKKSLGLNEINSGVSLTHHWLQVFRQEEIYKVLIHEILHNLQMDINIPNLFDNDIKHIHISDKSHPIIINEAYTEVMSLYLYTIFIGIINNKDIWNIFIDEEKFTIYQINKIFKHYNIDNISYFSKPNDFIQDTNIIPYYIIKYLLMLNMKYFVLSFGNKNQTEILIKQSLKKIFKLQIPKYEIYDKSLKMVFNEIE